MDFCRPSFCPSVHVAKSEVRTNVQTYYHRRMKLRCSRSHPSSHPSTAHGWGNPEFDLKFVSVSPFSITAPLLFPFQLISLCLLRTHRQEESCGTYFESGLPTWPWVADHSITIIPRISLSIQVAVFCSPHRWGGGVANWQKRATPRSLI